MKEILRIDAILIIEKKLLEISYKTDILYGVLITCKDNVDPFITQIEENEKVISMLKKSLRKIRDNSLYKWYLMPKSLVDILV